MVDPAHPFPFISGLSLNLAVTLVDPEEGVSMFARVKVLPLLPRFFNVGQYRYVPIEDVIAAHLSQLFGGMDIVETYVFRVTRVRELEVDEDVTENLLQAMERELVKRRFEPAVRLEVEQDMSEDVVCRLAKELSVDENAINRLPWPLDLTGLNTIADLQISALRYPPFVPNTKAVPTDAPIFDTLDERDVLVHHPYDSFTTTVQRLVEEAAADPRVLAIKQTLYRTSGQSPIVDALIDAAEAGKQVVVVVEIKARFDEKANITWARKLEEAGCHVVYGFVGWKTHAKLMLIVRQAPDGTCGATATSAPATTTRRRPASTRTSVCSPPTRRSARTSPTCSTTSPGTAGRSTTAACSSPPRRCAGIVSRIDAQAELARAGQPAKIAFKCNALVDEAVIDALYRASQAGVRSTCGSAACARSSRACPACRDDPGPQRARPVPRALADLRLRDRRPRPGSAQRGLPRQRRHDAQEPGSTGGVPGAGGRPGTLRKLRELIAMGMDDGTASWWLDGDGNWTRHARDVDGAPLTDVQEFLIMDKSRGRLADG